MKKPLFEGTATALVTPFTKTGVDFKALDAILDYQLQNGVNAVVVLGTTGEPATMSEEEKEAVVRLALQKLKGKIPVVVGAGANDTKKTIINVQEAERMGADGVLAVTPYYNKCTQTGLLKHYAAIANSTTLPVIVYNVPSRTGVNVLPETFSRLADIDNVVGIKEASGNMAQICKVASLIKDKATLYSGDDGITVPVMSVGGKGVISVASNVVPKLVSEMTRASLLKDFETAMEKQLLLTPLVEALFKEVNPIPVKKACELLGLCSARVRLPLTHASKKTANALKNELAKLIDF
ncbi:MAG: 4-hydroxy-tetrahydrodipicolinate synthase [Clostridia bacterium]|nr:4-hydroxy-tetrahydrodipicolinate synthase [Clostridia bacterium]